MAQNFNPDSYTEDRLNLQNEYDTKKAELDSSPTAYSTAGSDFSPSIEDLKNDAALIGLEGKIEALDSSKQKARWYGTKSGEGETAKKENTGAISKIFNALNKPIMWGIGAGQWLTGTNPVKKQGVFEAMDYNANVAKELSGDVLKKMGLPSPLANTLGFYLDMELDPINMITFGLGATVPRAVYGMYKGIKDTGKITGGLKLAKSGVASNLGKDFLWLESLIPGMSKTTKKIATAQKILDDPARILAQYGDSIGNTAIKQAKKTMETSGDLILEYKKKIATLAKAVGKEDELFKLGAKYDPLAMLGRTIAAPVEDALKVRNPLDRSVGRTMGGITEEAINTFLKSDDLTRKFKYSPTTDAALRKLMDSTPQLQEGIFNIGKKVPRVDKFGNKTDKILTFDDVILDNLEAIREAGPDILNSINKKKVNPKFTPRDALMEKVEKLLKESADISIQAGDSTRITDPDKLATAMEEIGGTVDEVRKLINDKTLLSRGITGIDWYDKRAAKLSNWIKEIKRPGQVRIDKADEVADWVKKSIAEGKMTEADAVSETFKLKYLLPNQTDGQRVLSWLEGMDNMFKLSKVAMGTASIINAYIGNPFMYKALGGKLTPEYFNEVYRAVKLQFGKASSFDLFDMFFSDRKMIDFLIKRSPTTKPYLGINFEELKATFLSQAIKDKKLSAEFLTKSKAEINAGIDDLAAKAREYFLRYRDDMEKLSKKGAKDKTLLKDLTEKKIPFTAENLQKAKFGSNAQKIAFDMPTGPYADLMMGDNPFTRFMAKVAQDAKDGDLAAKGFSFLLNEYPKVFQASDVSSKVGTFLHIVKNGLDGDEIRVISRSVGIDKRMVSEGGDIVDIVKRRGETFYKLTPDKAMEIGQEAYMNYAAMPAFVNMMKTVPILRSPFFSFSYAMLPKFGKALVHNPAFFNNISFAEREFSAEKGPIERENLKSKYYSWFDSPGVVKLPDFSFFKGNPAYANLTSINPFESMSITGENTRVYGDGFVDRLIAMTDRAGLFQHPVFRTLLDFLIIPSIQAKGTPVQGNFGQPLYPIDATKLEKAAYAARAIVDSYTPSMLAAPIAGAGMIAETMLPKTSGRGLGQALPLYFSRSIYHASRGETPLGINSKNVATLKSLASAFGFRVNQMDLSYTPTAIKDKINNN